MKIALLGYGQMGKVIEQLATKRGHEIVLKVTSENADYPIIELEKADVAIDFSRPDTVVRNVFKCFTALVPVVVGTTGWQDQLGAVREECEIQKGCMLHSSNFSIGVHLFFEINKKLAAMMNGYPEYKVSLKEIHHTKKVDAPSGTAITLAGQIIENLDQKTGWKLGEDTDQQNIPIVAERIAEIRGTHSITYESEIDKIQITHEAKSREGFALGSLLAAEWLIDKKPGCYSMQDFLHLSE